MLPRLDPTLLSADFGQEASNCDLSTGALAPAKLPGDAVTTLQVNTSTIHWFNRAANSGQGYWLQFNGDVDVVRGPIVDDTALRTYYTGDGVPKYTTVVLAQQGAGPYPGAARNLGLPAPDAPVAAGPSGEVPAGRQKVATAYVMTYVSDQGEEGPASFPSNVVDRWDGAAVALTGLSIASGQFVVVAKRIYRVELNGVYQFVAEVSTATTTFNDAVPTEELGEVVPSADWVAPHPQMRGLTALPNGVMAGFWGNTLAFSEPYQPHAWPIRYRLALDFDIVALSVSSYGLVVGTTGAPYLVAGGQPDSMGAQKMDLAAACSSKRSMVDMGAFVLYASPDGLVAAGGADARVITREIITPEQWQAKYSPGQIHAVRWGERYLGFYPGGSFTFSLEEGFRDFTQVADCTFRDEQTGDVYIKTGTSLRKWWHGANTGFLWRSKRFLVVPGDRVGCGRVDADAYPLSLQFYTDGQLRQIITVNGPQAFRIRSNLPRYRHFEVVLAGALSKVSRVVLASSMSEVG